MGEACHSKEWLENQDLRFTDTKYDDVTTLADIKDLANFNRNFADQEKDYGWTRIAQLTHHDKLRSGIEGDLAL
jgi:hypothetical protein